MSTATRKERPLGLLEKYQTSKQTTGAYGNISLTSILEHEAIPSDESAESFYMRHFQPALTQLVHTHPLLSVVIRDYDKSSIHFEQLTRIDFKELVDITHRRVSVQDLVKEQTDAEFDLDSLLPLWRLKVITESETSCTVALALHHTIGDGMSLSIFFKSFLEELNNSKNDSNDSTVIEVKELKCSTPYELSNAPSVSLVWDVVPVVLSSLVPKVLPTSIARWIDPVSYDGWKGDFPAIEGEKHNTELRLIHVPLDIWKPIIIESKKRGISAHAIEFIVMLLSWQQLYPNQSTEVATPINCRGLCNPPVSNNEIGNFVGAYTSFWTANELKNKEGEKIWQLAKKYYGDLQKNKLNAGKQALFLKFLPEYPASFHDYWNDKRKNNTQFGRTGGIELSDLGRFTTVNTNWKLKEIYFCQSAQIFTTAFGMNSISFNDNLFCTLSWQRGSLNEQVIDLYKDTFIQILKNLPLST